MIKRISQYFAIFALTLALTLVNTIAKSVKILGKIGGLSFSEQTSLRLAIGFLLLALANLALKLPSPISAILAIIAILGSALNAYFCFRFF